MSQPSKPTLPKEVEDSNTESDKNLCADKKLRDEQDLKVRPSVAEKHQPRKQEPEMKREKNTGRNGKERMVQESGEQKPDFLVPDEPNNMKPDQQPSKAQEQDKYEHDKQQEQEPGAEAQESKLQQPAAHESKKLKLDEKAADKMKAQNLEECSVGNVEQEPEKQQPDEQNLDEQDPDEHGPNMQELNEQLPNDQEQENAGPVNDDAAPPENREPELDVPMPYYPGVDLPAQWFLDSGFPPGTVPAWIEIFKHSTPVDPDEYAPRRQQE